MFVILVSSISLASEDPVDEDSPRNYYLGIADYFFTAIFTFEVGMKVRLNWAIYTFCWDLSLTTWPLMSFNAKSNSETVNFHVQNIKVLCFTFRKLLFLQWPY